MSRLLLCTDLDGTLLPNRSAPESPRARTLFARFVASEDVTLAYVTGRSRRLVEEALTEYSLPVPDFVIGDVGTTIHQLEGARWRPWSGWHDRIAVDWRGLTGMELARDIPPIDGLVLQEPHKQNDCKLSFYVDRTADHDTLERTIRAAISAQDVAANLVWSVDEMARAGLLDILPARASKLHALEYLQESLGFSYEDTVFAGDSGNDMAVLISRIPSVLVANAAGQVAAQAIREAGAVGAAEFLYLARGGFLGMNGNYAGGILEGVAHFHPGIIRRLAATDG